MTKVKHNISNEELRKRLIKALEQDLNGEVSYPISDNKNVVQKVINGFLCMFKRAV